MNLTLAPAQFLDTVEVFSKKKIEFSVFYQDSGNPVIVVEDISVYNALMQSTNIPKPTPKYEVVLRNMPSKTFFISVIKLIREITGLGLKEAKTISDNLQMGIGFSLPLYDSFREAVPVAEQFESYGVDTRIINKD